MLPTATEFVPSGGSVRAQEFFPGSVIPPRANAGEFVPGVDWELDSCSESNHRAGADSLGPTHAIKSITTY